jgi:hypothetical protein
MYRFIIIGVDAFSRCTPILGYNAALYDISVISACFQPINKHPIMEILPNGFTPDNFNTFTKIIINNVQLYVDEDSIQEFDNLKIRYLRGTYGAS